MSKNLKNISIVASATVASRVLGLVREICQAAVFGTSALNSAFYSAYTLPNLFRRLLGEGALTAAFVPTLTHELEKQQRQGAFDLVSKVVSWLTLVTTALVVVAMAFFHWSDWWLEVLHRLGLGADTVGRLGLGAQLSVVLFPYMVFVCLAAAFSAACQVLGRFTEPALSPIWLNLSIIGALGLGAWWAWGVPVRMNVLCAGVLLGGFFQMAVPAAVLWGEGWRPRFDLSPDDRVREMLRLMGPTVIGSAIYLINISISRFVGLSLNDSAASVLNLATRVMELPIGVFTAAISTVIFPLMARHAAREDWNSLGTDYHKGMRLVLLINVPAAVGLALLSEPIVRLLFQRGAFHASDTGLMTPILAVYALGLPFLSFTSLALRGFYAMRDTRTPVRAAGLSFVTNIVLSIILMQWFSTAGLALASNVAVVVQALYLQHHLRQRREDFQFAPQMSNLGKILLATLIMGAGLWAGSRLIGGLALSQRWEAWLSVAGLIPAAAAVYAGAVWLLRVEGREEVEQLVARLLRRQKEV